MIMAFRICIAAILAFMAGCMAGAFILIIEELRATRARHKRLMKAIDRIERPRLTLTVEELDFVDYVYHHGTTHADVKGEHNNVDSEKQD